MLILFNIIVFLFKLTSSFSLVLSLFYYCYCCFSDHFYMEITTIVILALITLRRRRSSRPAKLVDQCGRPQRGCQKWCETLRLGLVKSSLIILTYHWIYLEIWNLHVSEPSDTTSTSVNKRQHETWRRGHCPSCSARESSIWWGSDFLSLLSWPGMVQNWTDWQGFLAICVPIKEGTNN